MRGVRRLNVEAEARFFAVAQRNDDFFGKALRKRFKIIHAVGFTQMQNFNRTRIQRKHYLHLHIVAEPSYAAGNKSPNVRGFFKRFPKRRSGF